MTIQSELLIRKDPDPMLADPPPGWIRVEGDGAGGLSVVDENLAKTALGSTTLAKMQTAFNAGNAAEKDAFRASVSGGSAWLAPYLGAVADRTRTCYAFSAAHKQWQGRHGMYAMDDITPATQLQVVELGFYTRADGEQWTSFTVNCAIEYPAGTYTPVTWGGASTKTVASGGEAKSDPVSITIPRGAKFWYCYYKTSADGMRYVGGTNIPYSDHANGDYFEFATGGLTNKVGLGGYVNTDANSGFASPPAAIVGMTTRRTVAVCGDSRATGILDHWGNGRMHRGVLERSLFPYFANTSVSQSSETAGSIASSPLRPAFINRYFSDVIVQAGTNDIGSGLTLTRLAAIVANFPGKRVWLSTLSPITSSSDLFATLSGQTVGANEAERLAVNRAIRGMAIPGMYGYFDTADVVEMARSGKWNPLYTSDPSQVTAFDGLHETSLACQAIAASRVIDPAMIGYRA